MQEVKNEEGPALQADHESAWARLLTSMLISTAIVFTPVLILLVIYLFGSAACLVFGGGFCPPEFGLVR